MNRNIENLVSKAEGDTVSKKLLTELSPDELNEVSDVYSTVSESDYFLVEKPVIDYLKHDEEPQFIFHAKAFSGGAGSEIAQCFASINGKSLFENQYRESGGLVICFTNRNVILIRDSIPPEKTGIFSSEERKHSIKIAYDEVEEFEFEWPEENPPTVDGEKVGKVGLHYRIVLILDKDDKYEIKIPRQYERGEINNLIVYMKNKLGKSDERIAKNQGQETDALNAEKSVGNMSDGELLSTLKSIEPYKFEKIVAEIWQSRGWEVRLTSQSSDMGVDVIATKEDGLESRRHLIQAKRYGDDNFVDSEELQRYAGLYAKDEQVDNVFVVTTSEYTSEAKKIAENRSVEIINGRKLVDLLSQSDGLSSII